MSPCALVLSTLSLLFCWDAYVLRNPSGGVFTGMNLCVHTLMYSYYAATFFGRLPNVIRGLITALQLLQMGVGVAAVVTHLQCLQKHGDQSSSSEHHMRINGYCALAMYFSYLVLFAKLFYDSYLAKKKYKSS